MTSLELLVAISVIALLLALVIPAVQQARSSSRRVQCASRLQQIGRALTDYEAAHRRYPDSYRWRIQLLDYLDARPLAQQFAEVDEWANSGGKGAPAEWMLKKPVHQFICPSESKPGGRPIVNYYANMGTGKQAYGFNGFISPAVGPPFYYGAYGQQHTSGQTRASQIRDGLSNTAAVSEALTGIRSHGTSAANVSREELLRRFWKTDGLLIRPDDLPELARQCRTVIERNAASAASVRGIECWPMWRGDGQHWGPIIHGWAYDHILPPNSPSCGGNGEGVYSANSRHNGGVNVVFGDGHTRFVAAAIDADVWTSLGTRSGRETISNW